MSYDHHKNQYDQYRNQYNQYSNQYDNNQRTKLSEVLSTPTSSIISPMDRLLSKFDIMIDKINTLGEKLEDINKKLESTNNLLSGQPEAESTTWIQIELDSTHRNRKEYPNPSEFVVPLTGQVGNNTFNSQDPVSLGMPFETGVTQPGGSPNTIILATTSVGTSDNFYITCIIRIQNEYRKIISYDSSSLTATIETPFSFVTIGGGFQYWIKQTKQIYNGSLVPYVSSNTNTLKFPNSASNVDNFYRGMWIYMFTGPASGQYQLITSYDGNSKIARVNSDFTVYPGDGSDFEINDFSYDNFYPLRYSGTKTINQPVCYAITLTTLIIPKLLLDSLGGGFPQDYAFLYVTFYNYNKYTGSILYGNSPQAENVTFKVPLNLTSSTVNYVVVQDPNIGLPQVMKFNPADSYYFKVALPNGNPISFALKDTQSPYRPDPFVQITAVFAIKRLPISNQTITHISN